jgi:hypothetical protein
MRQFQNAAVNSMANTNPGFSGFMSNMMNGDPQPPSGSGQPPPMATQGPNSLPPPTGRPGNNNYANQANMNYSRSNFVDEGISLRENFVRPVDQEKSFKRPEMKGPSDLGDILSGLKTKTINIQEQTNSSSPQNVQNDSTISISDLKELQSEGNLPKRSKRRQKSSSNTISLDI